MVPVHRFPPYTIDYATTHLLSHNYLVFSSPSSSSSSSSSCSSCSSCSSSLYTPLPCKCIPRSAAALPARHCPTSSKGLHFSVSGMKDASGNESISNTNNNTDNNNSNETNVSFVVVAIAAAAAAAAAFPSLHSPMNPATVGKATLRLLASFFKCPHPT
ncbi:hypothetical protein TcWFU_005903 [Taenia crassiceps]|uniref:Uncharacterized protein n=1 Tax=Taenia crassiceps TaxID=6207 RepID=A0ABR4Q8K6_9CEST